MRLNLVLGALLVFSALALINAQYQARRLFIELERAQNQGRQFDVEYAQLKLDLSNFGKHARIEEMATHDLNMVPASAERTQYLTPREQP